MSASPIKQVLHSAPEIQLCKNFLISRSICIGINYTPNEKRREKCSPSSPTPELPYSDAAPLVV